MLGLGLGLGSKARGRGVWMVEGWRVQGVGEGWHLVKREGEDVDRLDLVGVGVGLRVSVGALRQPVDRLDLRSCSLERGGVAGLVEQEERRGDGGGGGVRAGDDEVEEHEPRLTDRTQVVNECSRRWRPQRVLRQSSTSPQRVLNESSTSAQRVLRQSSTSAQRVLNESSTSPHGDGEGKGHRPDVLIGEG